jgi:hypothetical protein
MNSITLENIKSLKANQLTELLLRLLHLEYGKYKFPDCQIYVPQNITTPDGGEDGRIKTTDCRDSRWIKDTFCLFQSKATSMQKRDCINEILNTKKNALKGQIEELFEAGGTYVLFTTDDYVEQHLQDRIDGFREAIESIKGKEYAENAKIEIYDSNKIVDWVNEYISAVSYVQLCCGIVRPLGIQIWSELKSHPSNSSNFKTNNEINNLIEKIRIDIFNKKNIRIEGVSGIGKTRLICETFSPGEPDIDGNFNVNRKSLSDNIIYFDIGKGNIQNIFDFIRSTVTTYPAILILDNCDPKNHEIFIEEVSREGSLQTLITIDYEKTTNPNNELCNLIQLNGEIFNSVVEEILRNEYHNSTLNDHDIEYLINFSEGNPKMAINFVRAAINKSDLNQGFDKELLEKLIFGREIKDETDFKILKLCSVFKYFEYPSEEFYFINKEEYNLLLEHTRFFSKFLNIDSNYVEQTIKKYLGKGVIERRGNKLIIRPNPLSLKLSILFWEELSIVNYESFIQSIPKNLIIPLADQLNQLGGVGNAKKLVETIWGLDGNFSTAEILNSNMGSRLFRSIVTVNPEATVKVLTKNYLDKPKEYLSSIVEGRQNLVWALERLCFREATFVEASKVLMCFAVAEIETHYSNNSTDYFTQLFRIYLAGTEVNYTQRIEILEWALEKKDPDFDYLVIKSCERAFTPSFNINKMLGAEKQGGLLTLEDYRPKSAKEINEYREKIIELLSVFFSFENEHQLSAQRIIYNNISNLFEFKFETDKLKFFIDIIYENIVDRDDIIKSLYSQVSFIRLEETEREFIARYIDQLKTNSIEERILYNVSEPKIIIRTAKDEEKYENKGKKLAEKFAEEVISEKLDIRPYFQNLLTGNQYYSFDFGKKLVELNGYDEDFTVKLISEILKLENKQYNISFFIGFISGLDKEKIIEIYNKLILHKSSFAFYVFRYIELNFENILKLIQLICNNNTTSNKLEIIKHDIIKLSTSELIKYFELIKEFENGKILIIDTFSTLIWAYKNNETIINMEILTYIKSIVEEENLLINISRVRSIDLYSWEEIMILLINTFQEKICVTLSYQILEYFESLSVFSSGEPHIANIANLTLDVDFKNCWIIYSKFMHENNIIKFWNIFDLSFFGDTNSNNPFFKNPERNNELLLWLIQNKQFVPHIIRTTPLFDEDGANWFYFTESLINLFGNDDLILDGLSANLHSLTTWGSRVPYLISRLNLVKLLKNHKLENIRNWAQSEIEVYKTKIEIEKIKDDEGFLGF